MSRSLGPRWRWLPRRPVGPDAARAEPLAVHRSDRCLGVALLHERYESITLALERLWVAHDTAIADLAEGRESLAQRLRFDLGRQVAHEYVMMVTGVELGLIAGTRGPVNLHLLVEEDALIHGGEGRSGALMIRELDEGIRIVAGLADYLTALDLADLRKEGAEQILRHGHVEVAHVQRTRVAFLTHAHVTAAAAATTAAAATAAAASAAVDAAAPRRH